MTATDKLIQNGGCDCHVHVFDDPLIFPYETTPAYAPPFSPVETLTAHATKAGVTRVVIVQPTPYGRNLDLLRAALRKLGPRARGVGVIDEPINSDGLLNLKREGIAGFRFIENSLADGARMPGTVPLDALLHRHATHLAAADMHAEIWAPLTVTLERWAELKKSGVTIVLDHMGGFNPALGTSHGDFQRLLALLREGAVWVKLSVCRRAANVGYEAIRPFHDALVEANSKRLLWATDFPFVRMADPHPTIGGLITLFRDWVSDATLQERILIQNPVARYGFPSPVVEHPR